MELLLIKKKNCEYGIAQNCSYDGYCCRGEMKRPECEGF